MPGRESIAEAPTRVAPERKESEIVPTVILEKSGGLARITLNRPEVLNCINVEMLLDFERVLDDVSADESVKVAVLSGAGRAFCTGADLKAVLEMFDTWADYVEFLHMLTRVFSKLDNLVVPTIAQVHGYALAGGLELILCCDMTIAADDARIGDQHSNFALIAGAGGIPRLVRRIGRQAALEILYTGKWLLGSEAAAAGIVLRSVAPEKLEDTVNELADQLRPKSRQALRYTKRAALAGIDVPLETALNEERSALIEYFSSSDHPRRGINAFLSREPAQFE
jgi:enoyl-CoA hydratase/carnithine racemase